MRQGSCPLLNVALCHVKLLRIVLKSYKNRYVQICCQDGIVAMLSSKYGMKITSVTDLHLLGLVQVICVLLNL